MFPHELANLIDLIHRDRKIQVETDERLDIGIYSLAADHAEAHSVLLEQGEYFLQEIGLVQSDGLPEGECFHGASVLRLAQPDLTPCATLVTFAANINSEAPTTAGTATGTIQLRSTG